MNLIYANSIVLCIVFCHSLFLPRNMTLYAGGLPLSVQSVVPHPGAWFTCSQSQGRTSATRGNATLNILLHSPFQTPVRCLWAACLEVKLLESRIWGFLANCCPTVCLNCQSCPTTNGDSHTLPPMPHSASFPILILPVLWTWLF